MSENLLTPPPDIGLPTKFPSWRKGQARAILDALASNKRFVALCAPTGSGKSLSGAAVALLLGGRTAYLTSTRGLQSQLMCVAPETKVLTADLRWVRADSIVTGDVLMGFDEERAPNRRMWRPSIVEHAEIGEKLCFKLMLADTTEIICSQDHPWLVTRSGYGGSVHWATPGRMRTGSGKYASKLCRIVPVWDADRRYSAGYLAAAFDGEGCLVQRGYTGSKGHLLGVQVSLSMCQSDNPMRAAVKQYLADRGFRFRPSETRPNFETFHVGGGRKEILRFLGSIRPPRLLGKFRPDLVGMIGPVEPVAVARCQDIGRHKVVSLSTSTRTFVAEGFAAHNSDFASIGLVDIRGMQNYLCLAQEEFDLEEQVTCDQGPCNAGLQCRLRDKECLYFNAVRVSKASSFTVTNYSYWLNVSRAGGLGKIDLLICDESHNLPQELSSFLSVELTAEEVEILAGSRLLAAGAEQDQWQEWAKLLRITVTDRIDTLASEIRSIREDGRKVPGSVTRRVRELKGLESKLASVAGMKGQWVIESSDKVAKFDPVWPREYGDVLFQDIPKVLLLSATVRPKTLELAGIKKGEYDFFEYPSNFPLSSRPIWHVPTVRLSWKSSESDLRLWLGRIDQVIDRRLDRKGIVHTVSFKRRDFIMRNSRHKRIMMTNTSSNTRAMVERFKEADPPAIFVSPSLEMGYDLPYDECRYIVVAKMPFPDSRDAVTKARIEFDPDYAAYITMQRLVQSMGRGSRAEDDFCEGLVLDDAFKIVKSDKYRTLAPRWFMDSIKWASAVPTAPKL